MNRFLLRLLTCWIPIKIWRHRLRCWLESEHPRNGDVVVNACCEFDKHRHLLKTNLGDDLNFYILPILLHRKVIPRQFVRDDFVQYDLMFIGSILNAATEKSVIWGAGMISENAVPTCHPARICAVRGPLTRDALFRCGISCPPIYGDPALLLPMLYMSVRKDTYRLGVVIHYADKEAPAIAELRKLSEIIMIHMGAYRDWHEVIDQICSCKQIISSSLHGVILADAYGVPNAYCRFSDNVIGGDFKFMDYFAGVSRRWIAPLDFRFEIDEKK